jgi:Protein of unknown function (DUF1326)
MVAMPRILTVLAALACLVVVPSAQEKDWYIKAHIDEACSCNLFCPCYFNPEPDGDRCNFNNVFTVEKGYYGDVKLDGMEVWVSGNLNGQLAKGFDGVVLAFEPSATKEQVEAFAAVAARLYVLPIAKVNTEDRTAITITHDVAKHVASRADNKGHVVLALPGPSAMDGKTPPVMQNLQYFGAQRNAGFKLYKGTHRYKGHGYDYSYENKNGFTIDVEAGSNVKKTT